MKILMTSKKCSKCSVKQPATADHFAADKRNRDGRQSCCRDCYRTAGKKADATPKRKAAHAARERTYRHTHNAAYREKERWRSLKRAYDLTQAQYEALLLQQNNCCALCNKPFGKTTPCVDHDHDTGKVRGLLHRRCNTALGVLGDNVQSLQHVVNYLKRAR